MIDLVEGKVYHIRLVHQLEVESRSEFPESELTFEVLDWEDKEFITFLRWDSKAAKYMLKDY